MNDQQQDHSDIQANLAAYALGSLAPEDRLALEAHLRDCAECQALLRSYDEVVDGLPFTIPIQQPPEGALERLIRRAQADPASPLVKHATPIDKRLRYLWAGFAALAALLLVMLGWNIWLQAASTSTPLINVDKIAIILPLESAEGNGTATGQLVMDADWKDCAIVANGLPPLDAERDYQLWFVSADGTRTSGVVFHPDRRGQIVAEVQVPDNWRDYERVGVTEEPAGGSSSPTGPMILSGRFAATN